MENLLGSGTRTKRLGSGTFRCPCEGSSRRYELKAVRRWVEVRGVPVLRLTEVGRYVECHSCASTFDPGVLAHQTSAPVEDVLTRILRRSAPALLPDRPLTDEERREAVIVLQRYTNVPYSSADLRADLARPDQAHLTAELQALANSLNNRGRDAVIDAGVLLASPNGHPPDPERIQALEQVAEALAIPGDRVQSALDQRRRTMVAAS